MTALQDGLAAQALGLPLEVDAEHGRMLVMSWETGRLVRLLANHPERRIEVPDWALPDFAVITGTRAPLPMTPPRPANWYKSVPVEASGPRLEDALAALTEAGCPPTAGTEGRWRALCPLCRLRGRYDRRVLVAYVPATATARLHCFSTAHTGAELLAAAGLAPPRPREVRLWRG